MPYVCTVQVLTLIQRSLGARGDGGANTTLNQSDFEAASSAVSDLIVKCASDLTLHNALHIHNMTHRIYYPASTKLHDTPPIRAPPPIHAPPRTRCARTGRYASDPTEVRTSDQNVSDDTIAVRKELKTQAAGFTSRISPHDLHTIPSQSPMDPSLPPLRRRWPT